MHALLNASSIPLSSALGFQLTCEFKLYMNSLVNGNMGSIFWADLLTASLFATRSSASLSAKLWKVKT